MAAKVLFFLFCLASLVHVFFYLLALTKLTMYSRRKVRAGTHDKPVSVVVCARNQQHNLRNLVPVLLSQSYDNFEIIIVDDRSEDGTYEYLLEIRNASKNLKIVRIDQTPEHVDAKKYALTIGIKAAGNDMLIFTDADCEPKSSNWLRQMAGSFRKDSDIVLGFSYYGKRPGILNNFIRYETIQTGILYMTMALAGMPYMGVGRNIGYRKSFFLARNGFSKFLKVTGGDDDLFVNAYGRAGNTRVALHPDSVVMSVPKSNFRDYVIQKIRHLSVSRLYKSTHKWVLGLFAMSKTLFWIAGLLCMAVSPYILWVALLFCIQLLVILWVYIIFTRILKIQFGLWGIWIMDFLYILYLNVFSLKAFMARRIKWS